MLKEKTEQIKTLCKSIKTNFLKVGKILIEIRDKELWKENHKSFTEYLESQDFEFKRRMAYNLIDVYNQFGDDVQLLNKLGIGKLIQLTYIPDKEVRKELAKKAETMTRDELKQEVRKVSDEQKFNQIHRKAQREDEDLVIEEDDASEKCKRQARDILKDIDYLNKPMNDMKIRIEKWLEFCSKFKKDKEIQAFKAAIFIEWKKLRLVK